ncbi:clathrin heavy chain [Anaeramoeba ignava]|uniref:Clathrin heavy chain n=1 Tax=Anaeramoeba ignava TaxID=1746090 RepID=A0A9Q0LB71_ANAIG|nr:clathrin heavy chain [Anaeramoeba ignava]
MENQFLKPFEISIDLFANLSSFGFDSRFFNFSNLSITSEKFLCLNELDQFTGKISVVNFESFSKTTYSLQGNLAKMNPENHQIALQNETIIQVLDLDSKMCLKKTNFKENVLFFKWITVEILAIITENKVYHWNIKDSKEPEPLFEIHESLQNHQIINYQTSENLQWLIVVGITQKENQIFGSSQLYSIEKQKTQIIQTSACDLASVFLQNFNKSILIFSCIMKTPTETKLYSMEFGNDSTTENKFKRYTHPVEFDSFPTQDFPIDLKICEKFSVIFVLTKMGYLFVFDLLTGILFLKKQISNHSPLHAVFNKNKDGIIAVFKSGEILTISGKNPNLKIHNLNQFNQLVDAIIIQDSDTTRSIFIDKFEVLFNQGKYQEAAKIIADSPDQFLRTQENFKKFQEAIKNEGEKPPEIIYYQLFLAQNKLNSFESIHFVRKLIEIQKKELIENFVKEDKLELSQELMNIFDSDPELSQLFKKKQISNDSIVTKLIEQQEFLKLLDYGKNFLMGLNYSELLKNVLEQNEQIAENFAKFLLSEQKEKDIYLIDVLNVFDIFADAKKIKSLTAVFLDVLKDNKEEEGYLQTKLLEVIINSGHIQVADAIIKNEMFSHYDRWGISLKVKCVYVMNKLRVRISDPPHLDLNLINSIFFLE